MNGYRTVSLLPSRRPDVSTEQEGDLRVLGVADDELQAVLDALSSETARSILSGIYAEPGTATDLADRTDNSVQTVSYHLSKLVDAGLIRVAATRYSEKGKEMDVYGPADDPVVVFVGTEEREASLRTLLKRLVGATALLLVGALFVLARTLGRPGAGGPSPGVTPLDVPFIAFLAGGGFVLGLVVMWWVWRRWR